MNQDNFFFSLIRIGFILFLLTALTIGCFIAAFAKDEGNHLSTTGNFFAELYWVLRFPTHTLFFNIFSSGLAFFIGLFINCVIYTLAIELLIKFFLRSKFQKK